ncbi:hypothetical protein JMJ77_0013374, partial [Colletotrichum scovillei]
IQDGICIWIDTPIRQRALRDRRGSCRWLLASILLLPLQKEERGPNIVIWVAEYRPSNIRPGEARRQSESRCRFHLNAHQCVSQTSQLALLDVSAFEQPVRLAQTARDGYSHASARGDGALHQGL